ncbi:hypothetical protein PREVCOP_04152 [Segatella copri DSM 18205]|uniref:Uncharacterized protein n=1 Tax=Segatella copri DSM 18205 TaxID=537011 RepID=D1PAC7_9BACT|nr:hypothetical protein PREVCOP_04152 [Segatella copri DSM 18205]
MSNLVLSGTGIGGLSPLVTGGEIAVFNYLCLAFGTLSAFMFAYAANKVMKYND